MKLFEQSLSGLEIITGELNNLIVEALLDDFQNGLENAFEDILDQAEEMRDSVEDEQLFDIGATLYRPLSLGVDHVLKLYAQEADNLFAQAMLGWGRQAGLESEYPIQNGLVEFRESRFSPNAAKQSLFVPPDWSVYQDSSIVRREGRILGSFDRNIAALREDILFLHLEMASTMPLFQMQSVVVAGAVQPLELLAPLIMMVSFTSTALKFPLKN